MTTPNEVEGSNFRVVVDDEGIIHRIRRIPTGDKTKSYLTEFDTLTAEEYTTLIATI